MKRILAVLAAVSLLAIQAPAATLPTRQISCSLLCPTGTEAANICKTYTNLGASFTAAATGLIFFMDMSNATQYLLTGVVGTAAVTGDLEIQCDDNASFSSPTSFATLANLTTSKGGTWTAITTGTECVAAGGAYFRVGMSGGDTTEDPVLRSATICWQ